MVQPKGSSTANSHQVRAPNQKRKQAHQNTFKYVHNRNSKRTNQILAMPIHGVCEGCYKILKWRKDYRKYKPLTQPRRCNFCQQKTVKSAYHVICDACCEDKKVCSKCLQPHSIYEPTAEERAEEMEGEEGEEAYQGELNLEEIMSQLPMRKQKTVLRKLEKGEKLKDILATIHFDTVVAQRKQRRQDNGIDFDDSEEEEEEELEDDEEEEEEMKPSTKKEQQPMKQEKKVEQSSSSLVDDLLSIEKELSDLQIVSKSSAAPTKSSKKQEEEEEEEDVDEEDDFDEEDFDEEEDL